jgi:hypothetical protein
VNVSIKAPQSPSTSPETQSAVSVRPGRRTPASYPWKYPPDADFVVLEDPDGNLFCVVEKAETA